MIPRNKLGTQFIGGDAIDLMKLICSLFVVVIHCKPFLPHSQVIHVLTAEGICRIAVPFFFTVSGLLFASKLSNASRHHQQRLCCKAVFNNTKLYLCWSAAYWLCYFPQWITNRTLTTETVLNQIRLTLVGDGSCYHFWYMLALIYAMPVMLFLVRSRSTWLVLLITILWPIQCLRYAYRWLPGGEIIPWTTMYLDSLMNTVFCALPLLSVGILSFRHYKYLSTHKWGLLTIFFGVLQITELLLLFTFSPNKTHFEFLLTMPGFSFCMVNFLLCIKLSFSNRQIPAIFRHASIWVYCIHPMLISIYGQLDNSTGFRRFAVIVVSSLASGIIYAKHRTEKHNNAKGLQTIL